MKIGKVDKATNSLNVLLNESDMELFRAGMMALERATIVSRECGVINSSLANQQLTKAGEMRQLMTDALSIIET